MKTIPLNRNLLNIQHVCVNTILIFVGSLLSATAIPLQEIGARAGANYKGDGLAIAQTEEGALLNSAFQRLCGEATSEGLWLTSTVGERKGDRFRIVADQVGRSEDTLLPLGLSGRVETSGDVVRFFRPALIEEYSTSVDGIRQDFLVLERPAGVGELRLELSVEGARAESAPYGARLSLESPDRVVAYSRLYVEDAVGREIEAHLEVEGADRLAIVISDSEAVYPIRIDPTFSDENWISMGGFPGADGRVSATVVDGIGNLYVAGDFRLIGDVPTNRIAKWDGTQWSALGSGLNNRVFALAVSEGALFVGGRFSRAGGVPAGGVARWEIGADDDSGWSALGSGVSFDGSVMALAVAGDGLYVGGTFSVAGGVGERNGIARWQISETDDSGWSALGSGVEFAPHQEAPGIHAMAVANGGLYVGGPFLNAGGVEGRDYVARWEIGGSDDSAWSSLGSGVDRDVYAFGVAEGGLYVGGAFHRAGGELNSSFIAKWEIGGTDDSAWSSLGSGVGNWVHALAVSGDGLYVGGSLHLAGELQTRGIARWSIGSADDSGWSTLGSGVGWSVATMAVLDGDLYVGGHFETAGGVAGRNRIAKWTIGGTDDSAWSPAVEGSGFNGMVWAVAASNDYLFAGGDFTAIGAVPANRIAMWDGVQWLPLGSGVNNGGVRALAVTDDYLYAGGWFTSAGGMGADRVAQWTIGAADDGGWSALGSGVGGYVYALETAGDKLYVGGSFTSAGGVSGRNRIAKWQVGASDDDGWSGLGSGLSNRPYAIVASGSDLYVGGDFTYAGGEPANYVAKWDGVGWSPLAAGVDDHVYTLEVVGDEIYAGGRFAVAGGGPAPHIAKWKIAAADDNGWSSLGSGVDDSVFALTVSGRYLYVGGYFTSAGGVAGRKGIARWMLDGADDDAWTGLGSGVDEFPGARALAQFGDDLYVGGAFRFAGGKVSPYLAGLRISDVYGEQYSNWAMALPADQRAPGDDPGGHGIENLLRYAFDMDPREPDRSRLPQIGLTTLTVNGQPEQRLTLTFTRRKFDDALSYSVELSTDLLNWEPLFAGQEIITAGEDSHIETVTVIDSESMAAQARRFLRVSVELGEIHR